MADLYSTLGSYHYSFKAPSGLTLTTAPTEEPLTLDEAKTHLRVRHTQEDQLILDLIIAARRYCESFLHQQLITATWSLVMDYFPDEILMPLPPLQSVSSITYVDTAGTSTTLATTGYQTDIKRQPGRIRPAYGEVWPSTRGQYNAVTIAFVAGYGAASAVPKSIKQAMRLLVGLDYEHREPSEFEIKRVHDLLRGEWHGEYL